MKDNEKTLVIVYQFGKVASTSLVNTLAGQPGLEVHQSHFLGESALQRIVPIAVAKSTNAYFHAHLAGQLQTNLALTYRVNQVLAGQGTAKLKVISLSREPLDWLRSGILQDIAGYRAELEAFAVASNLAETEGADALRAGLVAVLARINGLLDRLGGARAAVRLYNAVGGKAMLAEEAPIEPIVRRLFLLALRPLTWFEEHFRPCFGLGLREFECVRGVWVAHAPRADFALLRYEDLSDRLPEALSAIGLDPCGPLLHDNVSRTKPHAQEVSSAFTGPEAEGLRTRLLASDYAECFGYSACAEATAAE